MKKKNLSIVFIVLACFCGMIALYLHHNLPIHSINGHDTAVSSQLTLDQANAYIAISKNDDTGYNRWLPFYFKFDPGVDINDEDVERSLGRTFSSAAVYAGGQVVYRTTNLVWSSALSGGTVHNLTLVLNPTLQELPFNGTLELESIELITKEDTKRYEMQQYLVEQHDTIADDLISVSLSSIGSQLRDNHTATINYGVSSHTVNSMSLQYAQQYIDIDSYSFSEPSQGDNGDLVYTATIHLSARCSRTIFRPFLHVTYDSGQTGWLVPNVPVYIE